MTIGYQLTSMSSIVVLKLPFLLIVAVEKYGYHELKVVVYFKTPRSNIFVILYTGVSPSNREISLDKACIGAQALLTANLQSDRSLSNSSYTLYLVSFSSSM